MYSACGTNTCISVDVIISGRGGVPFPIQNIYQLGVRKHVVDSKVAIL